MTEIFEAILKDIKDEEIRILVENNFLILTVPELKFIASQPTIEEAKKTCYQIKKSKKEKIDIIVNNCKKEENLIQLKKAIEYGQNNIYVLNLIATSNTPYEIRKGFELGDKMTLENLYGTGYPAFNYLIAENEEVELPNDVLIKQKDGTLMTRSIEKNKIKNFINRGII